MSCNGCRVLRKGCSETCVLRHCLQCIDSPEAQAHATLFVTKFFGRAGLTGFIIGVPEHQRPALFQSLLYEACGRTVNPVYGAVGLLFSGDWAVCQAAVETVLRGGSPIKPAVSTSVATLRPATTAAAPFNSLSAAIDRAAGPISTNERHCRSDHITKSSDPSCHNINHESLQPLPSTEQSFVTSACSLKANSCHANPSFLLDFSNVSGSSSADQDTTTVLQPHLNKRLIRSWISESMNASNKDAMSLKRARLNLPAPSDHHHDAAHTAMIRPSITSWIAGFKNVSQRSAGSAGCSLLADADCQQASAVPADKVHDAASEGHVRHVPLHRPTIQRRTQDLLVAPVARRVYYTPQAGKHLMLQEKINGKIQGLHQESTVPLNNSFSCVECDDIRGQTLLSKADEHVESMVSSDGVDDDECGNIAISAKLDLSLKSHQSPLCCQQGAEELNTRVSLQQLEREFVKQDQEPQELWRVSSPSVNSEGSVNNTIVAARDILRRSSGFNNATDSPPKDGVKLLNLLL